jgi:hypothetical protein
MSTSGPAEKVEFVLFMSPGCKFCNNFINKLKTKPELIKKFNIVNIDALEALPDEVDEVPCVYDGKTVIQGAPAFKWLDEKLSEFLDAANDGLPYAFINGDEERVFGGYSLIEQKNGSYGIGNSPIDQKNQGDPTRKVEINDNTNKNRTLDSLMASRTSDLQTLLQT